MHTFRSDNNAGLCPEARQALLDADDGVREMGYGDDTYTARAVEAFRRIFGDETGVWFVATGTAANVLAIASLTEVWQEVVCHAHSHYQDDESTAPERLTHCRTVPIDTGWEKLSAADVERATAARMRGDVHQPQAGVVTLSNPTEFGRVYAPDEVRDICEVAHAAGYRVHVDGARFANAVAALGCEPRALSVDAGVDALSFGGTKNGLAFGEAVLFFPQGDGTDFARAQAVFAYHRKGTGHLLSKHRFVSAPFAATLAEDVWLRHGAHANARARELSDGLAGLGLEPAVPTEANGVFIALPSAVDAALKAAGHGYYAFGEGERRLHRLMCGFDTAPTDVEAFLAAAAASALR